MDRKSYRISAAKCESKRLETLAAMLNVTEGALRNRYEKRLGNYSNEAKSQV